MAIRLCVYMGLITGAWVGLVTAITREIVPVAFQSWVVIAIYSEVVALITISFCAAFACVVSELAISRILLLAFLVGVPTGLLLGPVAFLAQMPLLALTVCGLLGSIIGWLVCRLVCSNSSAVGLPVR
jgi:hypothetical protein